MPHSFFWGSALAGIPSHAPPEKPPLLFREKENCWGVGCRGSVILEGDENTLLYRFSSPVDLELSALPNVVTVGGLK